MISLRSLLVQQTQVEQYTAIYSPLVWKASIQGSEMELSTQATVRGKMQQDTKKGQITRFKAKICAG